MPDDPKVGQLSVQSQFRLVLSAAAVFLGAAVVLLLANRFLQSSTVAPAFLWLLFGGTGLVGAFILFSVLRSRAKGDFRISTASLTLGGPAAFFAAYLVGGVYLVPSKPVAAQSVSIVLQMSEAGQAISTSGDVFLSLGKNEPRAELDSTGRATFPDVPMAFIGVPVRLRAAIPGYELAADASVTLSDTTATFVPLKRVRPSSRFGATVSNGERRVAGAKVIVSGPASSPFKTIAQKTDEYGEVQIEVPVSPKTLLDIEVLKSDGGPCFRGQLTAFSGHLIPCSAPLR